MMRHWHTLPVVAAALFAGAGWVGSTGVLPAQDTAADATGAQRDVDPAGAPAGDGIDAFINQLGAADFRDREAAVEKLKDVGPAALPALKRALASDDPEVASRADSVIRHVERPPVPARLPSARRRGGRGPGRGEAVIGADVRVHVAFRDGVRRVVVTEQGRTVRIEEGANGIQMSVSGRDGNGDAITRDFQARTPDELRRQNPEAFELYDRWAGRGVGMVPGIGRADRNNGGPPWLDGRFGAGAGPEEWRPLLPDARAPADELAELRERLERQMKDADTPEAQQQEVLGLLERLRAMRGGVGGGGGGGAPFADADGMHRRMDAMNRQADALRERMKDLKLPDPGDTLPPPPAARLGITILEDPDQGVTVLHIMPESRARKMGLEPLDVIKRINGKDVTDAKALRRAVTEAKSPMVIEGLRDGEPLKLEEAVEDKPAAEEPKQ